MTSAVPDLAHREASLGRRSADALLDIVQLADPSQRLFGNGAGLVCQVKELAPDMGHAGCLLDGRCLARFPGLVEFLEAGIAIGMKDAAEGLEVRTRMLALAVGTVEVADRWRRLIGTGAAVADIGP
jgi:hypothetical protein